MRIALTVLTAALCLLIASGGCGRAANRPKTVKVTGVVLYNGQPVEGALVMLVATDPNGRGAVGKTDAQGKFTLTTFDPNDGAIPGIYNVAISKTILEGEPPPENPQNTGGMEPDKRVSKDLLPTRYKVAATSGLKAEIKEPGPVELKFELTD